MDEAERGEIEVIDANFLLPPALTARAQETFYQLSQSLVSVLMFVLVELARERMLYEQAQREVFERDYKSKRQSGLERRAVEAQAEGRRCWQLGQKEKFCTIGEQGRAAWCRAAFMICYLNCSRLTDS